MPLNYLDRETRKRWFSEQAIKIKALLDSPPKVAEVDGRVWRTFYWCDGEAMSALLMQVVNAPANTPANSPKVAVTLTRGFRPQMEGYVLSFSLGEPYNDVRDLVVFLRLDTVDPTEVEWHEVTKYSKVLTVRDILKDAKLNL